MNQKIKERIFFLNFLFSLIHDGSNRVTEADCSHGKGDRNFQKEEKQKKIKKTKKGQKEETHT